MSPGASSIPLLACSRLLLHQRVQQACMHGALNARMRTAATRAHRRRPSYSGINWVRTVELNATWQLVVNYGAWRNASRVAYWVGAGRLVLIILIIFTCVTRKHAGC